ncbi:histidine phosphatase family protein, partial [Escherichia coli]|nr:histidine phosphatase family protein [Escherichia coli]
DPEVDITVSPENGSVTRLTVDGTRVSVDYYSHCLKTDEY